MGLAGAAGATAALVLRNPTGEGWADRLQFFGHWVPTSQLNAATFGGPALWIAGLAVGMVARVARAFLR